MNHWANETNLDIETFILRGAEVTFPDAFAKHHHELLASIATDPDEAARWWHWQKDKVFPGEGWISIKLDTVQIMPMEAWTNVSIFWQELLNILEDYASTGEGEGGFSEETATFSIVKKGKIAVFELRGIKYPVEPDSFIKALLGAARDFFTWVEEYVGGIDRTYLERIKVLMDCCFE
ncbi:hypothetical protein [Arcanobacterium canis]